MAVNLRTHVNGLGASAGPGGCWTVFGCRPVGSTGGAWNSPCDLIVDGNPVTLSTLDQIGTTDDPLVEFPDCGQEFLLLYGCGGFLPCACPAGDCSRFRNYIFDPSGCCCSLPCDGDYNSCVFISDLSRTISQFTVEQMQITSVIHEGTEYVTGGPINLTFSAQINIGGNLYNPSLVNSLNAFFASVSLTEMIAELPTAADFNQICADDQGKIFRIKAPNCQTYTVGIRYPGLFPVGNAVYISGGLMQINGNNSVYQCGAGNRLYVYSDNTGSLLPSNCITTNEC